MPFVKAGKEYKSPSGKKYTEKQVKAYYSSDGFKKKPKQTKKKKW